MNGFFLPSLRFLCAVFCMAACTLLAACGGGDLVAGVGSGGSGVAEGTLSGFGSVIVDGIEYSELSLADADRSALRLGQRVRLVFDSSNTAQSIELRPQLRGPVTAALDSSGWLRLGGQWVRVVMTQDDSTHSGITLIDGFSGGAIASGQDAVAYGSWAWDASKASYVLVATRIESLATAADPVLLGGIAVSVGTTGLQLNADTGTAVTAARLPTLAQGTVVALEVPRAGVVASTSDGSVASVLASDVQDASLGATDLSPYQTVRLGGLANAYDSSGGTVTIQGTQLQLGVNPGGFGSGQFVRATAGAPGGNNSLTATAIQARAGSPIGMAGDDGTGAVTELKGTLSGVDWSAANVSFVLRGVSVFASSAQVGQACISQPASATLYVVVDGYAPSPTAPLRANSVTCTTDLTAADDV